MEKVRELESSGQDGGVDVDACGLTRFPVSMGLDLVNGPAAEGKMCCSAMFDSIPVVWWDVGCGTFGFEPAIER